MLCSFHCISLHPQPTSRPRSHLAFLWSCTPSFGMGYLGLAKATPSFDMGYLGLAKATPSFRMGYLGLAKASPSFGIGYLGLAKANGGLPFATQVCLGWSPFPHSILCSVVLCARSWDSISITPMVWKPPFSPKKPYTYRGPVSQNVAKHNSFLGSIISFLPCILCLYFSPLSFIFPFIKLSLSHPMSFFFPPSYFPFEEGELKGVVVELSCPSGWNQHTRAAQVTQSHQFTSVTLHRLFYTLNISKLQSGRFQLIFADTGCHLPCQRPPKPL